MATSSVNLIRTAALAETIATELARAAHQLGQQGHAAAAEALLRQARYNSGQALRLRAEASAEEDLG
jgi:hypothetical protein